MIEQRRVRKPKDIKAPHIEGHGKCCEYVEVTYWIGEMPHGYERGRTNVDQVGAQA